MISVFATSLIIALGFIYSAKEMHDILLKYVLRWPMYLFDTTPLGRVLNRFSKDVDVVDNTLPIVIRSWMFMFFGVKKNRIITIVFIFHFDSFKKKKKNSFDFN